MFGFIGLVRFLRLSNQESNQTIRVSRNETQSKPIKQTKQDFLIVFPKLIGFASWKGSKGTPIEICFYHAQCPSCQSAFPR